MYQWMDMYVLQRILQPMSPWINHRRSNHFHASDHYCFKPRYDDDRRIFSSTFRCHSDWTYVVRCSRELYSLPKPVGKSQWRREPELDFDQHQWELNFLVDFVHLGERAE